MRNVFDDKINAISTEITNLKIARSKKSQLLRVEKSYFEKEVVLSYNSSLNRAESPFLASWTFYCGSDLTSIMSISVSNEDINSGRDITFNTYYSEKTTWLPNYWTVYYDVRSKRQDDIDATIGGSTKTITLHVTLTGTDRYH